MDHANNFYLSDVIGAPESHIYVHESGFQDGRVKNVRKLTRVLTQESSLFKMLKSVNHPRLVVFVYNIVAVCLREEGILD